MMERYPDPIDHAAAVEQQQTRHAIEAARAPFADAPVIHDGVTCCRDCDNPIPLIRLAAKQNAARCVECQARHEVNNE